MAPFSTWREGIDDDDFAQKYMGLVPFISTKIIMTLKDNIQLKFSRLKKECNLS